MIKFQEMTPKIYYKQSRDFQFIGRLFDIVLNSVKTNIDLIYNLPLSNNVDDQMLTLLSYTLGFTPKHKYTSIQLKAICSVLPTIMRNKGSIKAITTATSAILYAEGIKNTSDCEMNHKTGQLTVFLPEEMSDISLIEDLLEYIIPAGISCQIVRAIRERLTVQTDTYVSDIAKIYTSDSSTDKVAYRNLSQIPGKNQLTEDKFSAQSISTVNRNSYNQHSTVQTYVEDDN